MTDDALADNDYVMTDNEYDQFLKDQFEYPAEYNNEPVTIENWTAFNDSVDFNYSSGYLTANKDYTDELEARLHLINSFAELKKELFALISEKRKFIEFGNDNCTPNYC